MTLPRVLTLDINGHLCIDTPDEIKKLRRNLRQYQNIQVHSKHTMVLDKIWGECIEIEIEAEILDDSMFSIKVRMSPDQQEETIVTIDVPNQILLIDTSHSSQRPDIFQPFPMMRGQPREDIRMQSAPLINNANETLLLRIYIDKSIVEVFANSNQFITQRVYQTRFDSVGFALFSQGHTTIVKSIRAWDLEPTNISKE